MAEKKNVNMVSFCWEYESIFLSSFGAKSESQVYFHLVKRLKLVENLTMHDFMCSSNFNGIFNAFSH